MKKLITLVLVGAALAVPAATAAPMKGKPPGGTKPCHGKAKVMVVLKGTLANDPVAMARAFRLGVEAGRTARRAGVIEESATARASSPVEGLVRS